MINVPNYTIHQVIFEDEAIVVCHATFEEQSREVLLKIVKEGSRAVIENAKVMNEYENAGSLDIPGILKPIAMFREGNRLMMTSEWVHGMTLRHYVRMQPVPMSTFLTIAAGVTHVLEQLHEAKIVHMNIRPETIVVVPSSLEVRLTGFGHAVVNADGGNTPLMEGSPPYMAPERTGRLDRAVRSGTDLYSLGVTLYEMLSGTLPFEAKEPLEWAHAHVARTPLPLSDASPGIPAVLERIIMKLLEKPLDRRYKSAGGLKADLERCLTDIEERGKIVSFELGMHDVMKASKETEPVVQASGSIEGSYGQVLDLAAVMHASQAFNSEKDPIKLMSRLMDIIIEVSGAEHGIYMVRKDGQFVKFPPSEQEWLSVKGQEMIERAAAQQTRVVHNDTSVPISILALPIEAQREIQGVLYLENRMASGVFAPVREPILNMLAIQIGQVHMLTDIFVSGPPAAYMTDKNGTAEQGAKLTRRELDILRGMADGLSNKEIAGRLMLSDGTVKVHARNLFEKLKVNNRVKAVAAAAKLNLFNEKSQL